jgi:hypothetical protein
MDSPQCIVVSKDAFLRAMLHACQHPTTPVYGVLLAAADGGAFASFFVEAPRGRHRAAGAAAAGVVVVVLVVFVLVVVVVVSATANILNHTRAFVMFPDFVSSRTPPVC